MALLRNMLLAASALVVGLGLTTACSRDNPNSPGNPSNPNAPRIAGMSPETPTSSGIAQTLTFTGERFVAGQTILLDAPNGVWTTYSGSAINVQSATAFTATVLLNQVGVWDITVTSAGLESNEVQFIVR